MTPNWIATIALFVWPVVAVLLFLTYPVGKALIWTILGAYLLLPVGTSFKMEMIPLLDKSSIPNLCALVGCLFVTRLRFFRRFGFVEVLLLAYLAGPVLTSALNGDYIAIGNTTLPGVGVYDGISAVLSQTILILPFFLAREIFRSSAQIGEILQALVVAGLAYSVALLFEIRFSPQLHYWLYGYYPSDFIQTVREGGGFRPMVFMGHGLIAGFFTMTTAVAAAALWRTDRQIQRMPAAAVTAYLTAVLVLCRSGAALVYGTVLIPVVRWTKYKFQRRLAFVFVAIALLYPMLRAADIFPTSTLVELAKSVSADRAWSLQFRFNHEQKLLDKASERWLFGWGRYGRNRVYTESGGDASVTDGRWIITFGQFGLLGFLAEFGLLALPIFRAAAAARWTVDRRERIALTTLALIVSINLVELLPNSTLGPWTWLVAGALLGRSEMLCSRRSSGRVAAKMQSLSPTGRLATSGYTTGELASTK